MLDLTQEEVGDGQFVKFDEFEDRKKRVRMPSCKSCSSCFLKNLRSAAVGRQDFAFLHLGTFNNKW